VVALSKIDLMDDLDWLDLVEEDVRRALGGTVLEAAPIVRVSARTRQGIPELIQTLGDCLAEQPPRADHGRPRLPVDRVFTISGFGTVVTGTLTDGQFRIGDEVELLPRGLHGRIRGLQTHQRKEEIAVPGGRTAVNISGLDLEDVQRGDVVTHPGDYSPTRRIDVRFRLLPDVNHPLEHNTQVKFFIGAAEVLARVRLLGSEYLLPGEEGWLQLELREAVTAMRGDRYILRRPSPGETLGGG
jgi:selenocysteine-specific elongation factor